ncbi:hypothetical protein ElyMa_002095400 [Elysia marginata]|uniref:Uncharacterized protein n=1 Tax=Elysia marginata TaxID=1093978 RepID=A0AAV4FGH2_9GAST|nr:hypothetical protein ElyMa_002095400 [Elysia marginata]
MLRYLKTGFLLPSEVIELGKLSCFIVSLSTPTMSRSIFKILIFLAICAAFSDCFIKKSKSVCASDGKLYDSRSQMNAAANRKNITLTVVKRRKCRKIILKPPPYVFRRPILKDTSRFGQ